MSTYAPILVLLKTIFNLDIKKGRYMQMMCSKVEAVRTVVLSLAQHRCWTDSIERNYAI